MYQKQNEFRARNVIKNCIITIDATGCQTAIAEKIIEQGADYILQVKGNQKHLLEEIEDSFLLKKPAETQIGEEVDRGRVETRKCFLISDLELIEQREKWRALRTIIKVESEVYIKKTRKTVRSTRYYISSLVIGNEDFNLHIRSHWSIESMHWNLDVIFKEDHQAKRNARAIENTNILNKLANTLLEQEKTFKKSKPRKRMKAFIDSTYREKILQI